MEKDRLAVSGMDLFFGSRLVGSLLPLHATLHDQVVAELEAGQRLDDTEGAFEVEREKTAAEHASDLGEVEAELGDVRRERDKAENALAAIEAAGGLGERLLELEEQLAAAKSACAAHQQRWLADAERIRELTAAKPRKRRVAA